VLPWIWNPPYGQPAAANPPAKLGKNKANP
jgi:hypothetical protein